MKNRQEIVSRLGAIKRTVNSTAYKDDPSVDIAMLKNSIDHLITVLEDAFEEG